MSRDKRPYQDRQWIKLSVRGKLRGKTVAAFAACVIPQVLPWVMRLLPMDFGVQYLLLGDLIVGISLPMLLLSFVAATLVTDPMYVRVAAFFLRLNNDPDNLPSPLSVCDCFGPGYGRLVLGMLLRSLRMLMWAAIPLCVGALLPGSLEIVEISGMEVEVLRVGGVFSAFALVAVALYVYRGIAYSMVPYLLADDPTLGAGEALRHSLYLTRGRIVELLFLELSFLGWFLLASVTMLIAAVYAYPYMEGAMAAYYINFTEVPAPPEDDGEIHAA